MRKYLTTLWKGYEKAARQGCHILARQPKCVYASRPPRRSPKGFYRNHFATLQSTSSCTKSTVFGTFLQTCEGDLAFWSHSELLATYASIFLRYFDIFSKQNIAKSSLCNQFERSPSQVLITAPKVAFWVQKEVFCNVVKRFQLEPFGDLLGGRLTYTHFGRFASILQHCRATCLQPFCKVAKYFLVHQLHHFWNLSATLQGRNVSFMQGFCN